MKVETVLDRMWKMTSLEIILARAITKIAHKACRNGEAGTRAWPNLDDLPEPKSWQCVGDKYAPQVAAEVLAEFFPNLRLAASLVHIVFRRGT